MTYNYKETQKVQLFCLFASLFDIFILPLIIKGIWNNVLIDIVNLNAITYIQALSLKFGYSALTQNWISSVMFVRLYENRFDDYANMISTRLLQVKDDVKAQLLTYNVPIPFNWGYEHIQNTQDANMT
jgi:hypothetical protein